MKLFFQLSGKGFTILEMLETQDSLALIAFHHKMFCKSTCYSLFREVCDTLNLYFHYCAGNNHSSGGIWIFCISELAKKSRDMVIAMVTILLQ